MRVVATASTSTRSTTVSSSSSSRLSSQRLSPRRVVATVARVHSGRSSAAPRATPVPSSSSTLEYATNDDLGGIRSVVSDRPFGDDDAKNAAFEASTSKAQLARRVATTGGARAYAMKISYDGTRYNGFQYQGEDVPTIQRELERALVKMTGRSREELRLGAAGRTDAGVHARGQVAHFYVDESLGDDLRRRQKAMNGMLAKDIRVEAFWEADPSFHSRFHAVRKTYRYYVDARVTANPFRRAYAHQVGWRPCDVDRLRQACACFVGTMDYAAFCNASRDKAKNEEQNTTRTIHRFDVVDDDPADDGLIRLEVEGDGFLYRQVRNMVGAALFVASGKHDVEYLRAIIESKDRSRAPMGAPARGLFLHEVVYPDLVLRRRSSEDDDDDDES